MECSNIFKLNDKPSELRLIKTMWGVDGIDDSSKWADIFARVKADGFQGIEAMGVIFTMPGFKEALATAGLVLVGQVHTTSVIDKGFAGFRYMTSNSVADHVASLKDLVQQAQAAGAIYINAHSGVDAWGVQEAREYLVEALKIEKDLGIDILHETHRRRIFWNPFNYRDICKGDSAMDNVKVNLDISHWVVCLERIFATEQSLQENGPVDTWWPEVLAMLQKQCHFIHARVGYGEGPQVPDPSAPEYKNEVAAHMMYWSEVMKGQIANKRVCFVEPEHGPWPYQQSKPHTETAPVTDIWVANNYVAKLVVDAFPKLV